MVFEKINVKSHLHGTKTGVFGLILAHILILSGGVDSEDFAEDTL